MKRFGAILLFAGAVLVSTHILAPAAAPPQLALVRAADLALIAQTSPVVEQVDAQVDRLRERLASPPAYPPPLRDPFRFGERAASSRPKPAPPAPVAAVLLERPTTSVPALPHLVAIATNVVDGTLVRTAVLSVGDDIQIVKTGEMISKLLIRSIGIDAVELTDPVSGAAFKISLQ